MHCFLLTVLSSFLMVAITHHHMMIFPSIIMTALWLLPDCNIDVTETGVGDSRNGV